MIGRMDEVTDEIVEHIELPLLPIYHQNNLIDKINKYFAKLNRPLWSTEGYCHGLAVVWQQKMADRRERQFYNVIKRIIHKPEDKLDEFDDDVEVQKFIAQVEYAQRPYKYRLYGSLVRQIDVDSILETSKELYKKEWFSIASLVKLLYENRNSRPATTMLSEASWHTVAVYFRDDKYYIFDANYSNGEAKEFSLTRDVVSEMAYCLYTRFGKTPQQWVNDLNVIMTNPVPSKFCDERKSAYESSCTLFPITNLVHQLEINIEETLELKVR